MANENGWNLSKESNHPSSFTARSSWNATNDNLLPDRGSHQLIHQHHNNGQAISSSNLPLGTEYVSCHPSSVKFSGEMPGSSYARYHQSLENKSRTVQHMHSVYDPQSQLSSSYDAGMGSKFNDPLETEFSVSQNVSSFKICERNPCENNGSQQCIVQASDGFPPVNQQLLSEEHSFSENRCNTVQVLNDQAVQSVDKFNKSQNVYSSQEWFAENVNNYQESEFPIRQLYGNEFILVPASNSFSHHHQQQRSSTSVNQDVHPVFHDHQYTNQTLNSPDYFPSASESGSSQVLDLSSKSNQCSEWGSNDNQNFHPEELQQPTNEEVVLGNLPTLEVFEGIGAYGSCPPARMIRNKLIIQDNLEYSTQPTENEVEEPQTYHLNPQNLLQIDYGKLQEISRSVQSSSTQNNSCGLTKKGSTKRKSKPKKKKLREPEQEPIFLVEYFDLGTLRYPYSNRADILNILVYGSPIWTRPILQTYARGRPVRFESPFSMAYRQNVTRCGVVTTVVVWLIEDLMRSVEFLRTMTSTKCTVMFVLNQIERVELFPSLVPLVALVRQEIAEIVPIIFVGCKSSAENLRDADETSMAVTIKGYKMKAALGLSAFLECGVDTMEEVDAVFFTAMDVSNLEGVD